MTTRRCDTCEFWVPSEQYNAACAFHPDDYHGACHRHAPSPTRGDVDYEVLKFLQMIAWTHADEDERKREFDNWEEAPHELSSWPGTNASQWCGDWQAKSELPDLRPVDDDPHRP